MGNEDAREKPFHLVNLLIKSLIHISKSLLEGLIDSLPQLFHLVIMSLMIFNTRLLLLLKGF